MISFWIRSLAPTLLLLSSIAAADNESNSYVPLEMTEVAINKSGEHPYGQLRTCPDCPPRLLPFAPDAVIYVKGQPMPAARLENGQILRGTVFVSNKPIESIREIVDKQ